MFLHPAESRYGRPTEGGPPGHFFKVYFQKPSVPETHVPEIMKPETQVRWDDTTLEFE